ncbi:unnamed protein product [Callosobruchus maculatus]|uniref:MADF domain-containing protein n=1 Tax=Callosobruchus maculatus TaxID=64391 RepID=A0A653BKG7_CALMS|nr:unnamed protein product [Callosobruchus maculatus]
MGEDEVYRPTLWYYDKMSFLNDHLQIRSSRSSHPITEFAVTEEEALVVQAPPSEETTMYLKLAKMVYCHQHQRDQKDSKPITKIPNAFNSSSSST